MTLDHLNSFRLNGIPLAPVHDLGTLGGDKSVAYAINSINTAGRVVGGAETVLTGNAGVLSSKDVGLSLKLYLPFDSAGDGRFHAFNIPPNATILTTAHDMGTLGGNNSVAYAINNSNPPRIVGTSQVELDGPFHAFRHTGPGLLIAADDQNGSLLSSCAYAVNVKGEMVGMGEVAPGEFHAFLWCNDCLNLSLTVTKGHQGSNLIIH